MASRRLSLVVIALVLLLWTLAGTQPVHNPDIWYHLKTGEYINSSKTIPKQDFFSHTATGRAWIAQWWFYDVVVYQIQSRFGFNGLVALKTINAVAIALVLLKTMSRFKVPAWLSSLLLAWGMLIIANAWVDRPHLFSYFYLVLLIDSLIAYQKGSRKSLLIIPPLLLIWANTHASVPLAIVLLGFALISQVWHRLEQGQPLTKAFPKDLAFVSLFATLISFLNPNTYKTHLYVLKINPEFVAANIIEWIPLNAFFHDYHIQLFLVFGALSLLTFITVTKNNQLLPKGLRTNVFEILIYFSLSYMALSALRFAPVFVLILLPFTAKNVVGFQQLAARRFSRYRFSTKLKPQLIALVLLLVIIPVYEFKLDGSGTGVSFYGLPAKISSFLLSEQPAPELYHPFNWGGFLIWHVYPTYRVFIDGRLDMYVPDIYQTWLDVVKAKENWSEILAKYRVNIVTISNDDKWLKLGQALESSPDWVLVYWDDQGAVFVRDIPQNHDLIERLGLKAVLVFNTNKPYRDKMADQASREYRRLIRSCPDCTSARNKLGVLYLLNNKPGLAKKYFRDAIRIDHSYAIAITNYAYLLERERRYNDAIALYQTAIQIAPRYPFPYRRLGMIFSQKLHYNQEALSLFEKYLQLAPNAPDQAKIKNIIKTMKANQ